MVRPVPAVELEALKFTTCSSSGVSGENVNAATVGTGMVDVVVVVVEVDVVVSVIFTVPDQRSSRSCRRTPGRQAAVERAAAFA